MSSSPGTVQAGLWPTTSVPEAAQPHQDLTQRFNRQVVAAFVGFVALLTLVAPGTIVRFGYPPLAVIVGIFLFQRSKPAYLSFSLWIWFLSAFLRRVVDFRAGYQESSPILVAPYLVTMVAILPLFTNPRSLLAARSRPIFLAACAVFYGFCVGLSRFSVIQMAPAMLNWLAPLCIAYFIVEFRHEFKTLRESLEKTCTNAAILMGAYTVYQFVFVPGWDAYWLDNVRTATFGTSEPMQMRAFSTMGSPVAFALAISSVLLIVIGSNRRLRPLAVPLGLVALILTLNRSAWICFLVGLLLLVLRLKNRERTQILLAFAGMVVAASCLLAVPDVSVIILSKLDSFSTPNGDVSYQARVEGYKNAAAVLLREPFGEGVGSPDLLHQTLEDDDGIGPHDSLFLELLYSLGWLGASLYLCGISLVLIAPWRDKQKVTRFLVCIQSIPIGLLAQSLLNDTVYGGVGIFFWLAAGVQIVSSEFPQTENSLAAPEPVA